MITLQELEAIKSAVQSGNPHALFESVGRLLDEVTSAGLVEQAPEPEPVPEPTGPVPSGLEARLARLEETISRFFGGGAG